MHETAAALVDRAKAAGAVTPDVDPLDVLLLCTGIALANAPARTPGLLRLIRRGVSTP
jgi:hypothetical protein